LNNQLTVRDDGAIGYGEGQGVSWRRRSSVMMCQVVFDRFAVLDDLIANAARRPKGGADGERRGKGRDFLHLRVVMMVMVFVRHPHMMTVMMRAGHGFRRVAYQH
jgi:hypothetical protein